MTKLAIIGGTGLTQLANLNILKHTQLSTPFGVPSAAYVHGELNGRELLFLARHGNPHTIPPHKINYRANIWGLKELGVTQIIAVAAVGGISSAMEPAHIAIPNQLIDYSYERKHTFFEGDLQQVTHIDFSYPYTESLRTDLIAAAKQAKVPVSNNGTYGCTQGPRLETAAEIRRMQQDGCDLVGMTGMPEAALARELELEYAALTVVANWGAGIVAGEITMAEIEQHLHKGMANAALILQAFLTESKN
ncbi:MAG: S-methyl-5'-thioinosine phosphorylase [Methylococcaceae bacterium]|nr:S-methyl-5'-thioinosine phosphorylase [Methylococcaceae bacterium]